MSYQNFFQNFFAVVAPDYTWADCLHKASRYLGKSERFASGLPTNFGDVWQVLYAKA